MEAITLCTEHPVVWLFMQEAGKLSWFDIQNLGRTCKAMRDQRLSLYDYMKTAIPIQIAHRVSDPIAATECLHTIRSLMNLGWALYGGFLLACLLQAPSWGADSSIDFMRESDRVELSSWSTLRASCQWSTDFVPDHYTIKDAYSKIVYTGMHHRGNEPTGFLNHTMPILWLQLIARAVRHRAQYPMRNDEWHSWIEFEKTKITDTGGGFGKTGNSYAISIPVYGNTCIRLTSCLHHGVNDPRGCNAPTWMFAGRCHISQLLQQAGSQLLFDFRRVLYRQTSPLINGVQWETCHQGNHLWVHNFHRVAAMRAHTETTAPSRLREKYLQRGATFAHVHGTQTKLTFTTRPIMLVK